MWFGLFAGLPRTQRIFDLLPPDFAQTGLLVSRPGTPVPSRFQVLGERSSGTNLVKRLLARNTGLRPTEALGWKHGHPSAVAIPADLAVVCMVRNAADWSLSMHAKPWHTVPEMQALPYSDFIRAPWVTVIDRARYFDGSDKAGVVGQPLQADRNVATGAVYDNLFALRRGKLQGLLSYFNRNCTFALVRTEAVQSDPQAVISDLARQFGLPAVDTPFRGVSRRLGSRFNPAIGTRPDTPKSMSEEDRAFMIDALDPMQEAALGYAY